MMREPPCGSKSINYDSSNYTFFRVYFPPCALKTPFGISVAGMAVVELVGEEDCHR